MTFPTDWDVDKYRVEHESDEHWDLRRRFLVTHKDKYPEDRLVCLAQVFYNVEFMGCRYPEKTMRLVAQLSLGVADDHREKMKTKLQRTFVQASDAASTKVKGRGRNDDTAPTKPKAIAFQKSTEDQSHREQINQDSSNQNTDPPSSSNNIPGRFVLADQSRFQEPKPNKKRSQEANQPKSKKPKIGNDIFSSIVLMRGEGEGMHPYGILTRSAAVSRMTLKLDNKKLKNSGVEVTLSINDKVLATAKGRGIDEAKSLCAAEGLAKLKKICYTLIVKDRLAGSVVDKNDVSDPQNKDNVPSGSTEHLAEDSKVNRMMKLMGWGGGGLGKNQQGRKEPVQVVEHVKRAGLGKQMEGGQAFKKHVSDMLQNFKRSNASHDIVFASDFSKEERKLVHNIANRLGLKSVSYGKDADRQLVVSRKKSPWEIVEEVKEAGGSTAKYDLIPPEENQPSDVIPFEAVP